MGFLIATCCMLHGYVHAVSGASVAGASVTILERRATVHARTGATGTFSIQTPPGPVTLVVVAQGFRSVEVGPIAVDGDQRIDVGLVVADTPALRTIGTVRVNGALTNVHQFVPNIEIGRAQIDQLGFDRVIQALADVPSVTFARPDGGASTAPVPIALRGPDPSETLVMLDGQILNDGNTGDVDVSQLPASAFSGIEISEGLGPIDLQGSNTFGGAVNLFSLRPTLQAHAALSASLGSFGRSEVWTNATGTQGSLGYALALDDTHADGYVDQGVTLCAGGYDAALAPGSRCLGPKAVHLGSTSTQRSALLNLDENLSQRSDVALRIFTLGDLRDMSGSENAPVFPNAQGPGAYFVGPGNAVFGQDLRAYDLRARFPLGAGTVVADASADDDSLSFTGSGISPYDVTHTDRRGNLGLSWERDGDDYVVAFGGYVRHESLFGDFIGTTLTQEMHSYFARGEISPVERIHLEGGAYLSDYSTFGTSLDGRFGIAYDLGSSSAVHASVGTGFRAPLLVERYVFPLAALPRDVNGVYVGQGNPNEQPERATEYELGYSKRLADAQLDASVYRTNLRQPIENVYPLARATSGACSSGSPPCVEYPINVGDAVYEGWEIRATRRFGDFTARLSYGVNVAYPENLPPTVSNPTSGGSLVNGEQFLDIPQQQASFDATWRRGAWHAALNGIYRGRNNELNAAPFGIVNAAFGRAVGAIDVSVAGTNLTNAVSGKFTLLGRGVTYSGAGAEIPTDLYAVEPTGFRVIVTARR
ncbi:MAG: TonB-dependent receptor [Candidatus Tyrphobacter sp.]